MSRTVLTVASGMPRVPRGHLVKTADGRVFVVVRTTATTLTLTPFRWWHRVPWLVLALLGAAGVLAWYFATSR